MKKALAALAVALILVGTVACSPQRTGHDAGPGKTPGSFDFVIDSCGTTR